MHLRYLLTAAALLLPAQAFSLSPSIQCQTFVTYPLSGATAVPANAVITGTFNCTLQTPDFVDETGATIAAKLSTVDVPQYNFTLTPLAPLSPNHTYSVTFPDHRPCDGPVGQTQFTTGGKPGIRAVQFQSGSGQVGGVDVFLTEPVLHPADLADGTTWVTASVDAFSPAPPLYDGAPSADAAYFYYKKFATTPTTAQTFHVRLHKGLQFASGTVLADDIEVSAVPDEMPWGWTVTGSQSLCPGETTPACSAQPVGHGRWALLAGLLTSAALILRRRCTPFYG